MSLISAGSISLDSAFNKGYDFIFSDYPDSSPELVKTTKETKSPRAGDAESLH